LKKPEDVERQRLEESKNNEVLIDNLKFLTQK
jgi:hypothetical protein